jgi:hypothetical protein
MPRELKYHPEWDLFPLNRIPYGTGIKTGTRTNKKLDDYLWLWRQYWHTLLVQQASYISHDTYNLRSKA